MIERVARIACLAALMSTGCKAPAPDEQMEDVRSWLATAELVAQAWVNHTTPEKYTRETLELSSATVRQTAAALRESPAAGADSPSLDSLLTRSSAHIDRIGRLVTSRDAPAVRSELDSLRADEKLVKDLAERLKPKQ